MSADKSAENIPNMPQNLSVRIVCPSPKVWDFDGKRLHWASVVRDSNKTIQTCLQNTCNNFTIKNLSSYFFRGGLTS